MRVRLLLASASLVVTGSFLTSSAHAEEAADSSSMQSGAMFGFGLGMMTVGAAGIVTGAAAYTSLSSCDDLRTKPLGDITRADLDSCSSEPFQRVGAIVGIATGGAFFLAGVPLAIFGGVSRADERASTNPGETEPTVSASIGPTGGALRVSF